jgi:hypothetical protein
MKKWSDHRQFFEELIEAIQKGQLDEAIVIAEKGYTDFPNEKEDTLYWKACLYAGVGRVEDAVACFKEACTLGIWWSHETIYSEPDLKSLYSNQEFLSLTIAMAELEELQKESATVLTQYSGRLDKDCFSVHLHWKNDTIDHYQTYYTGIYEALDQKCLFIQSSQPDSSRGYCWDDEERSIKEITTCLARDFRSVSAFCGSSQGGRIALKLAVAHGVNYYGIMPAIRNLEILESPIPKYIKFRWLIGSRDFFLNQVQALHEKLLQLGYDSRLEVVEGVGHYFAPALKDKLKDFLSQ